LILQISPGFVYPIYPGNPAEHSDRKNLMKLKYLGDI